MAFNPALDGHKINMRSEYADTVTRKWTRTEVDNIMQMLVFDSNSSALASEAMTLDAVDAEWMGDMMVLDSAVITTNMRTLNGKFTESISRTLTRKLSPDLSISGNEVGKVKKSGLYASIAAIFRVSDGQTVTIIFHAPDGDPKVIAQDDTLIAFRVLMNKTDITSHVLPQLISIKGVTSLDQVSTNIASLLKANSGTFTGKQAQIASQKKELEEKTAELRKLESAQAEAVQMEADAEQRMKDADEKGAGLESRIKRMEEDNAVLQEKIDKLKAKKSTKLEYTTVSQFIKVDEIQSRLEEILSDVSGFIYPYQVVEKNGSARAEIRIKKEIGGDDAHYAGETHYVTFYYKGKLGFGEKGEFFKSYKKGNGKLSGEFINAVSLVESAFAKAGVAVVDFAGSPKDVKSIKNPQAVGVKQPEPTVFGNMKTEKFTYTDMNGDQSEGMHLSIIASDGILVKKTLYGTNDMKAAEIDEEKKKLLSISEDRSTLGGIGWLSGIKKAKQEHTKEEPIETSTDPDYEPPLEESAKPPALTNAANASEDETYKGSEPQQQPEAVPVSIASLVAIGGKKWESSQTNPHVTTLRSIVSGDYDNKPLPEVETALFTAADALEATGLSDQYDDLIGKAAEKYAELDQKANG